MALFEHSLSGRIQSDSAEPAATQDRDDRLVLQPLLLSPNGLVRLENPPRVIFAGPQEFVGIE